ncbi:MAG: acyltransferase [Paracoccaceae bacterium]
MTDAPVQKAKLSKPQRLLRLLKATLDPRALAHLFKVINYYNYTHVAELRQAHIGKGAKISPTASFANARNLYIGDRVSIGANVSLWAGNGSARIVLGDDVLFAPNVLVTTSNYRFNEGSPVTEQAMDEADVVIGNDVWLGYGAIVLPGVKIGDRAIIGAGALVRKDVPPNGIAVGNPARVVGTRDDPQGLARP